MNIILSYHHTSLSIPTSPLALTQIKQGPLLLHALQQTKHYLTEKKKVVTESENKTAFSHFAKKKMKQISEKKEHVKTCIT